MEELELEEEALLLNREMLTEVKNLIDDINDIKPPNHLKQFIHPQWGSILGSEEDIRLAVLQDEVELCEQRVENDFDAIPYLGNMLFALKARIKELSPNKPSPKTQVDEGNYEYLPKRPQHVIDEEKVDEGILERHDRRQMEMFDDPYENWSGHR